MKVTVIGTGYVGLVTGTCLAETGNDVICVDIDEQKVNRLKDGIIPIYEKGLEHLVKSNYESKRLNFTTDFNYGVDKSDIIIIAVGTPPKEDGSADLQHVLAVAKTIGQKMKSYKLVVSKSTVPVGTGDSVREAILKELATRGEKIQFSIASNPEFLKEGSAVADFMKPDRILIGCDDEKAEQMLRELYGSFVLNGHRFITMDIRSAELCKYASNAMLATKISFMN
ncbi:MAG: nucleotide sugar dehydrogenase, partial [Bdellovibrionota bacterium]